MKLTIEQDDGDKLEITFSGERGLIAGGQDNVSWESVFRQVLKWAEFGYKDIDELFGRKEIGDSSSQTRSEESIFGKIGEIPF